MTDRNRRFRLRGWPAFWAASLLVCGCASYQFGNQSLCPADVQTVYVPVMESVSFRRGLGERLTEAVIKEIELRTPFKVVNNANADSELKGRIVSEGKGVLVPGLTGDARDIETRLKVQVSWVDRRGRELRNSEAIPLPSEVTDVTGTGDLVPEVGQSVATAQQKAICKVAQQIVGLMEKPW